MLGANGLKESLRDGMFGLRLSVFFIAIFFIVGCYMPFLPVWLKSRELTDAQISLIYAVPVIVRALFTPAMTFAADRSGRPVALLKWLAWGGLITVAMLPFTGGFPSIFTIILIFTLFWMSVIPVTDSLALTGARAGKADYGRMRLWGSFSYIAMTSAGGVAVDFWGPQAALWLFIGAAGCVVFASYWLPPDRPDGAIAQSAQMPPAAPKLRLADMLQLIRLPDLWLFFAAAGAIQSAHALYYIFGTLHWTSAGISPTVIGSLWGIGVIAEIALFAYGRQVSHWFGPAQLLVLAAMAAVIRWTITAYDPPLAVLFAVQTLHGLTFGAAHLGAMQFIDRAIPDRMASSAQGLYASVTVGFIMGIVSLAAGPLYRSFGGEAYLAMAFVSVLGLLLSLALMRRWTGGPILTPTAREAAAE
ncbi:MAG: MFS transporter [Rhodomicrobium sp.]|nr:MFS transporter [Rhodomicrobium sp.]